MTPEEFRRHGHAVVDWVAGYLERVGSLPVQSRAAPGETRARLPEHPPEHGEPFEQLLRDVEEIILPGLTHWQSPNWFGYFPANSSGPSVLGELLSAGLGVQGMLWSTSPACTELETLVLDWLAELLGLPPRLRSTSAGGGVIQDSASSALLCALLAARERATGGATNRGGVDRALCVYASTQAHSSVEKAVRIAGLGSDHLRLVEVDDRGALRVDALAAALAADRAANRQPCAVVATVGTTSSTAVDPVRAVGQLCREHGLWLHVDAAMCGTAAVCPEYRWLHDGVELADSYVVNPHKWMFVNFDCTAFYVADRRALVAALGITPEYLRNRASDSGAVIDYRDWQIPLGRRFRALKLWFVLRHYGAEGLRRHVREHVAWAQEFAAAVAGDPRFELAVPAPLNLVCFRHVGGDAATERIRDRLNDSGALFLSSTRLGDRLTLRLAVGSVATRHRHVERAWALIQEAARDLPG
jgi:aromatic-L-amino-acid decarboxylase